MKNKTWIFLLIIGFGVIFTNSCKNDDNTILPPTFESVKPLVFNPNLTYGTLTDIDNNVYKTIKIGNQTWMAENLKVTRYRNGDYLLSESMFYSWSDSTNNGGACCGYWEPDVRGYYNAVYGKLYNFYAITDSRNLCPTGWHIPSDNEWNILKTFLGVNFAEKLKETGKNHWVTNQNASNESGFTAVPGGIRNGDGSRSYGGIYGYWWSSSEINTSNATMFNLTTTSEGLSITSKKAGLSIRCVKDSI
jgi:uncharacterized protein (TIGR02145 family)